MTEFQIDAVADMLDDLLGNAEDLAKISDALWAVGLTKLAHEISAIAEMNRDITRNARDILMIGRQSDQSVNAEMGEGR